MDHATPNIDSLRRRIHPIRSQTKDNDVEDDAESFVLPAHSSSPPSSSSFSSKNGLKLKTLSIFHNLFSLRKRNNKMKKNSPIKKKCIILLTVVMLLVCIAFLVLLFWKKSHFTITNDTTEIRDRDDNEETNQNILPDPSANDAITDTESIIATTIASPPRPPVIKDKEPTATLTTTTTTNNSLSRKRKPHHKKEEETNSNRHQQKNKKLDGTIKKIKSDLMNGMEVEQGSVYFYLQQRHDHFDNSFLHQLADTNIKEGSNFLRKEELGEISSTTAANQIVNIIRSNIQERMEQLYQKSHSHDCRAEIAERFSYYLNAITYEKPLSYISKDMFFHNECPVNRTQLFDMYNRRETWGTYKPSPQVSKYMNDIDYKDEYVFLYTILIHDHNHDHDNTYIAEDIINLIQSLQDDEKHLFIIHVDAKECHDKTFNVLKQYAASHRKNIYVLPNRLRTNIHGYSVVQATLQMLKFAFSSINDDTTEEKQSLSFHKVIHLPSSILNNSKNINASKLKKIIQSYPVDANIMDVHYQNLHSRKSTPWKYVVECDDAIHEIDNLPILNRKRHNTDIFFSNQKSFIISRDFAKYLASSLDQSFIHYFSKYAKHIANANDYFFATVLLHSTFCHKFVNVDFFNIIP